MIEYQFYALSPERLRVECYVNSQCIKNKKPQYKYCGFDHV